MPVNTRWNCFCAVLVSFDVSAGPSACGGELSGCFLAGQCGDEKAATSSCQSALVVGKCERPLPWSRFDLILAILYDMFFNSLLIPPYA